MYVSYGELMSEMSHVKISYLLFLLLRISIWTTRMVEKYLLTSKIVYKNLLQYPFNQWFMCGYSGHSIQSEINSITACEVTVLLMRNEINIKP